LRDQKTNFRLVIYSQSSASAGNVEKIGPVDIEIIGLTEYGRVGITRGGLIIIIAMTMFVVLSS